MTARLVFLLPFLIVSVACASVPTPTQTFPPIPDETPTLAPEIEASSTPQPEATANPGLQIDGMATLLRDVDQIADPEHPNHQKENRRLDPIDVGAQVYLVDRFERRKATYWRLYDGSRPQAALGWVSQTDGEDLNLEPFQPDCPSEFPLSAASLSAIGNGDLACFGQTELTLSGRLQCDRAVGDSWVGGPIFVSNRQCRLDDQMTILGKPVTSLLDDPAVDTVDGSYLIRGHFDDPGSQSCGPIPFGTDLETGGPPTPETIMFCRTLFVATNAISRD